MENINITLKSAPVGKSIACHTVGVFKADRKTRSFVDVAEVKVFTNVGDHGKTNREIALKAVKKMYPDCDMEIIDTIITRYEMPLKTFVKYAVPVEDNSDETKDE